MTTIAVNVRGHDFEVEIDRDYGYDYDTGSHDVDWHFVDMSRMMQSTLTDEEENAVMQCIYEVLSDPHYHDDDDL